MLVCCARTYTQQRDGGNTISSAVLLCFLPLSGLWEGGDFWPFFRTANSKEGAPVEEISGDSVFSSLDFLARRVGHPVSPRICPTGLPRSARSGHLIPAKRLSAHGGPVCRTGNTGFLSLP